MTSSNRGADRRAADPDSIYLNKNSLFASEDESICLPRKGKIPSLKLAKI